MPSVSGARTVSTKAHSSLSVERGEKPEDRDLRRPSLLAANRPGCHSTETNGAVVGGTFASRLPFLFAVAFVAAGLGDAGVGWYSV